MMPGGQTHATPWAVVGTKEPYHKAEVGLVDSSAPAFRKATMNAKAALPYTTVAGLLLLASGFLFCFVTVGKGEVGVLSWFGSVEEETLSPGPWLVHPFKKVYRMNTQTQKDEEPATVPTKNGLPIAMKATLLYRLAADRAPMMAREVGADNYQDRVVSPYFKNAVRDVTAEFLPEAFYSSNRSQIEAQIVDRLSREFEPRGLVVESVMLLEPVLPALVQQRIEAKVGAEQDAARMEYVLKQKELEARAKVVEAKGIAESQTIIKKDLDDNYIRYLWVMALKEHSGSIIYVPTGADGLPFFKPVHPGGAPAAPQPH